jgi:c-di-GMP-binding flagellar brake protein YcgR
MRVSGVDLEIKPQRRKYFRVSIEIPIVFVVGAGAHGSERHGFTDDLTPGGVRFRTERPLEEGDVLRVSFNLAHHLIEAKARVTRAEAMSDGQWSIGAELFEIAELDQVRLARFLFRAKQVLVS